MFKTTFLHYLEIEVAVSGDGGIGDKPFKKVNFMTEMFMFIWLRFQRSSWPFTDTIWETWTKETKPNFGININSYLARFLSTNWSITKEIEMQTDKNLKLNVRSRESMIWIRSSEWIGSRDKWGSTDLRSELEIA